MEGDPKTPLVESGREEPRLTRGGLHWVRNIVIDTAVSWPIVLVIGLLFELFTTEEGRAHLRPVQQHFYAAVNQFDPTHLFVSLLATRMWLAIHVRDFAFWLLSLVLPVGVVDFLLGRQVQAILVMAVATGWRRAWLARWHRAWRRRDFSGRVTPASAA
jgi:hypothetical protein